MIIVTSYGQSVGGYYKERLFTSFDMHLWTYCINPNHSIFNEHTIINEKKTEWTKGLTFMENKKVSYLPIKVYKNFPNLIAINAFNCSLRTISQGNFEKLKELQYIGLSYNFLSFIPPNTFQNVTKLKYLFISNNHLQAFDETLFKTLVNLRNLHISHNKISLVPKTAFSTLVELRNISLSFNYIQRMDNDHFEHNKKVERVWLNNNQIGFLSSTMFDNMPNLKSVNLEENRCVNVSIAASKLKQLKEKVKLSC
jgi:Leucine-rich repeat (LRR) protein